MARPRRDGAPPAPPLKKKITEILLRKVRPQGAPFLIWDSHHRGLALMVQPSGSKAWKVYYRAHGRPRWHHLAAADAVGIADARRLASRVMFAVAEGKDPAAERKAERGRGTFAELAARYVTEYAKRNNKSWQQGDALARKYLLPRWGKLSAAAITRADARAMMTSIEAPVLANQVLAAASAIFMWAIKQELIKANPCALVERNETKSRERILSDAEIPTFWTAFDAAGLMRSAALTMILLTGQRPGEVAHMRKEHVEDGWWTMPGDPVAAIGWPGAKNGSSHRVWLPTAARDLMAELIDGAAMAGFVFANNRGRAVDGLDAAMRDACKKVGAERATPHDLRRTHGTTIASLGFGRDAMNRIQNHREGGIASVYDRHQYAEENKRVIKAVASRIMALVTGDDASNVVRLAGQQR
jgi:integrase